MKFTHGFWQMRPGVTAYYPAHAYEVEIEPAALTVYGPIKRIEHRGDSIDRPLLTVRFSSPAENIIRVQLFHHKGGRPRTPQFELQPLPAPQVTIRDDAQSAALSSGHLSVQVEKAGDWRVDFIAGGALLTSSGWHAMGYADTLEGRFIFDQLSLGVGECVCGLGERFAAFVKNGQVVDMWNEDGGTGSEQAYKNVPFYLTNRGYGIFVNHPERVSFEVASEQVERVQFSVPGESLEYFVIYGPGPKEVLERYTLLTGRPALPPAWSFGLWLSTSFTPDYDEEIVQDLVQGMAGRNIPLHVLHFDGLWMRETRWCDFRWDERKFPDPPRMLRHLKEQGIHACVWINPYIAQRSSLFDEAAAQGYLLKRLDGSTWQTDLWQPGMGSVDFTHPGARRWYADQLRALLEMGVDVFKTDFGERIPTDVAYFDGSDPHRMHNYYSYLYNRTVFEVLRQQKGSAEALVFARSATAGGQQFPVHWGGDSTASYASMAESLRGGLSLGLSGFGFWSHDIGGFERTASADLYKRWCAFGLLSSHSRLHAASTVRVPWLFDEEAVDVLRFFTQLKCRLMPYLFGAALQAHQVGAPMLRAMLLEFPNDPACDTLDRQYMLGDSLLVAPVFSPGGEVSYYVPGGCWTSLISGQVVQGPGWVRERHGYLSLPLLARPGAIIAVGTNEGRPDYDYADGVTLQAYQLAESRRAEVRIPSPTGEAESIFFVERQGRQVVVNPPASAKPWKLLLAGIEAVDSVENGTPSPTLQGLLVTPASPAGRMVIRLKPD